MQRRSIIFYTILFALILSFCTIQKRTYQKGYYVHWKSNKSKKELVHPKDDPKQIVSQSAVKKNESVQLNSESPIIASRGKDFFINPKEIIKDSINKGCGDSIWFKRGFKIKATVLEVSEETVKYETCGNYASKIITVSKKELSWIRYQNGGYEFFEDYGAKPKVDKSSDGEHQASKNSLISLILEIFGLVLLGFSLAFIGSAASSGCLIDALIYVIMALFASAFSAIFIIVSGVLSSIALYQVKKHSIEGKTKSMTIAAFMLFLLLLILLCISIALLFAL